MRSISKAGKIFFAGAIVLALVFLAMVVLFAVSCVKAGRSDDLGYDIGDRNVIKMTIDENGARIAGTQDGSVFAFDGEGALLWDVGQLEPAAVYDLQARDGVVYAAYASGAVITFREEDARAFTGSGKEPAPEAAMLETALEEPEEGEAAEGEGAEGAEDTKDAPESFLEHCYVYPRLDAIGGNIANTQLLLGDGEFWLRARFNDGFNRYHIYRFSMEGGTPEELRSGAGFLLGGMALCNGELYYAYRGGLWQDRTEVYKRDQDIIAVSASETELYLLTADGVLAVFDPVSGQEVYAKPIGEELDSSFSFSTGENFLVKGKNGGVLFIDCAQRKVALDMNASYRADFILWNDDCFALRDRSDVDHPFVIFYTFAGARSVQLFGVLRWVSLGIGLAALVGGVLCAVSVREGGRQRLVKESVSLVRSVWRDKSIYLALVIPFTLLIIFYYIPIVLGFSISFMDYLPGERSVFEGFRYYGEVLRSGAFWEGTGNMVVLLIADLLKALIPPFIIAELIFAVRARRFSLWVRILLFLPGILPGVATTLVWQEGIFGNSSTSLLNALMRAFVPSFVEKDWLMGSVPLALFSVTCFGFPWVGSYLIFYGALGGINSAVFEAARLDGCSWWRRVLRIDIPMILSQFKYVLITSFIASVQNYGTLYILYGAGDTAFLKTPALLMYGRISNAQYNTASVMGVFLFLILAVATFFNFRSQREQLD